MLIDTERLSRCRRRRAPVAAFAQTAAALDAVLEARAMGLAEAGAQALPDAATHQLQAHVQQLVYQLADASAAPAAVAQAADAGQQVMRGCQAVSLCRPCASASQPGRETHTQALNNDGLHLSCAGCQRRLADACRGRVADSARLHPVRSRAGPWACLAPLRPPLRLPMQLLCFACRTCCIRHKLATRRLMEYLLLRSCTYRTRTAGPSSRSPRWSSWQRTP